MIEEILRFKRVASTQDIAKRLINRGKELAVFAQTQTQGRGRRQRVWFSPVGGLYLSVLFFPESAVAKIPLIAALSVITLLKNLGFKKLGILWPNDILLNKKKVCGILCERYKNSVVCGIGLNVNIKRFPAKLSNATSLFLESGKEYNIEEILQNLLYNIESFYCQLQRDVVKIEDIYHYFTGIGEMVEVSYSGGVCKGTVFDIDEDWGLLLRDETGVIKKFYYGDIKRLKW
ncbi:MAG: biotin--[acetyl-CoA-carboxylase] ligase [candidate division WOR-3 bacterium]